MRLARCINIAANNGNLYLLVQICRAFKWFCVNGGVLIESETVKTHTMS